jgi:hypothetical protein
MEDEVENVGVAGRRERCTLSYHLSKVECLGYVLGVRKALFLH